MICLNQLNCCLNSKREGLNIPVIFVDFNSIFNLELIYLTKNVKIRDWTYTNINFYQRFKSKGVVMLYKIFVTSTHLYDEVDIQFVVSASSRGLWDKKESCCYIFFIIKQLKLRRLFLYIYFERVVNDLYCMLCSTRDVLVLIQLVYVCE